MAATSWSEAVLTAVRRHVRRTGSTIFSRQGLIDGEMEAIVAATGSSGATPWQTLSRVLQELRDAGRLEFVGDGIYRYAGQPVVEATVAGPTKGVFVIGANHGYTDVLPSHYQFPSNYRAVAERMAGQWIVYQRSRRAGEQGYFAVAKVEQIVPDPSAGGMYRAVIEAGSYLDFASVVPFQLGGMQVERGLRNADGSIRGAKQSAIRPLGNVDFNRIVELGLMEAEPELPRVGEADLPQVAMLGEPEAVWEGPVDRATMLVNRKVRDVKFRRAVLHAYDGRCALTGMKLVNGGGRLETEAAHVMSVAAGGPDAVSNGIALSGTVHWMFDRGLISLGDAGEILLSGKINDREGVEKIVFADGRARWPKSAGARPHSRYLAWHREQFGFAA